MTMLNLAMRESKRDFVEVIPAGEIASMERSEGQKQKQKANCRGVMYKK